MVMATGGARRAYTAGAPSLDAFTIYAYLTKDFTAMSAIYTHHQYIAGFFLLGALYLIGEFRYSVLHMLLLQVAFR